MSTSSRNSPSVYLFGPTGVGKTRFLTEGLPPGFEVIAVDSIQIYRGLDIGSAKPTPEEQARITHHLIDIRDPGEAFDVGDFVAEASAAVHLAQSRDAVPILSGGTAFYFHNYHLGMPETPPSDAEIRKATLLKWEAAGEAEFRKELAGVDSVSEARIMPHDAYRLQRAWEVWVQTGRPLSSFGRRPREAGEVFIAGLDRPREELYRRIENRVDEMLKAGLEDEVRVLASRGLDTRHPGMRGIGYAEWFPFVRTGEGDRKSIRDKIVLNSRRYAKRQLTFFRSLPGVRWYHPDQPEVLGADLRAWALTNAPGWW